MGHRNILHANRKQAVRWQRYGAIGQAMRDARFNHLIHHQLNSSNSWTRERVQKSRGLSESTVSQLNETEFGGLVNPTFGSIVLFSGPPLLLITPFFLVLSPGWLPIGALIALSPYMMTAYVHPFLHEGDDESATRSTTAVKSMIQATVGHLKAYHAEHHRQPRKNYNLLFGGDQVLSIGAMLGRRLGSRKHHEPTKQVATGVYGTFAIQCIQADQKD
jgi:hypothetical protein